MNKWLADIRTKSQTKYKSWGLAHKDERNFSSNFTFMEGQGYALFMRDSCQSELTLEQVKMVSIFADSYSFDYEYASESFI
mmetsp:Transcript_67022/g.119029  ORF Transcript_67022/g.119029 Transcript_67022/m.119029 type:complete len:81 (-) Transcript_67022:8-250(-)